MNLLKKNLNGGYLENPYKQLEVFISLIILGYFGVKVIYGLFFKFYPSKYYFHNIEFTTNQNKNNASETENVILNAYMPGMWNTEITDFVVTIILSLIIYIYTYSANKTMLDDQGNINIILLFGYLIGLGFPPMKSVLDSLISNEENQNIGYYIFNCINLFIFIMILIFIILGSNYSKVNNDFSNQVSYITYICVIFLLLFGLYISRKKEDVTGPVQYYYSNGKNCQTNDKKYIKSSSDILNLSPVFLVFISLLLFSYNPDDLAWKNIYIFLYGLFLGVFVSGISYFGIQYFLIKKPMKQCNSLNECLNQKNNNEETEEIDNIDNNQELLEINKFNTNNFIKLMLIIGLFLIISFLIYNFMKK